MHTCNAPRLDARLAAAYDFVRPGHAAADIGCDHGKLSAALAGSGRCPLVLACDLRPGPLEKARVTCAPYGDKVQCRLGSGLSVLEPGEADDIIIAGMGAETIIEILEAAPWVFDARYNLVLVPATKHSILRRWLARRGFALRAETLCQAAGRWYAVMNAQYTGAAREPDGFAQAAVHLAEYRKMEPAAWEEFIFYDHPSGRTRIRTAMQWKAEHLNDAPSAK